MTLAAIVLDGQRGKIIIKIKKIKMRKKKRGNKFEKTEEFLLVTWLCLGVPPESIGAKNRTIPGVTA